LIKNVITKIEGVRDSVDLNGTIIGDESAIIDEDNIHIEF
jgi:hypothetical protein